MTAVIPTNRTRVAIVHPAPGLKDIISRAKEIADNAKRMARLYQEVEKGKADMPENYTKRTINHPKSESHHHQPRTTPRAIPGPHPASESENGTVQSESKPTKLGKRSTPAANKTCRIDLPELQAATSPPPS
jgi:hypothetical protein